jgi:3-methyladenine DNA glycosylase AlkD
LSPKSTSPAIYQAAVRALRSHADPAKAAVYRWYFKDTADDTFLGVTTSLLRGVAKEFWQMPLQDVLRLMKSGVHEELLLANEVLRIKFVKGSPRQQEQIFRFYARNMRFVRGWAGVDGSAPYILGAYLLKRSKKMLYQLAGSERIWDRRIAIVSTMWFIRQGEIADTLKIAKLLLRDEEDLIHKATGWMLREVGKKDASALKSFLKAHGQVMPRTMLRYAIERFPEGERRRYLKETIKDTKKSRKTKSRNSGKSKPN